MRLPELNGYKTKQNTIAEFLGLQKNKTKMSEKQFENCKNMSHEFYPAVGNATNKKIVGEMENVLGYCTTADGVYYIAKENNNVHLYYNGNIVKNEQNQEIVTGLTDTSKQMVMMGAYLVIWPDKIKFNTHEKESNSLIVNEKFEPIKRVQTGINYEGYLCTKEGDKLRHTNVYPEDARGGTPPGIYTGAYYTEIKQTAIAFAEAEIYRVYWIEKITNNEYNAKYYIPSSNSWKTEKIFFCIHMSSVLYNFSDFFAKIKEYENETIEIVAENQTGDIAEIIEGNKKIIKIITNGNSEISIVLDIDMWVKCLPTVNVNQNDTVLNNLKYFQFVCNIPDMDFITCAQNRIWGCSSEKHEIYASKLGSPGNFSSFQGLSSDSYTATIGSSGEFTGICTYNDYPVFFKENRIITWYGTRPSNYQLDEIECDGIKEGCEESIAYVDGNLFYVSPRGIMRYTGSFPALISQNLGDMKLFDAIAAGVNGRYFVSCKDQDNIQHLYTYELATGIIWENTTQSVTGLIAVNNNMYAVIDNQLVFLEGKNTPELFEDYDVADFGEEEWYLESGDIIQDIVNKAVVQRLFLSFELNKGAWVRVSIKYDNEKKWTKVVEKKSEQKQTFNIRVMPKRCEKIKLKFEGKGGFVLYQITRTIKKAGEI